MSIKTFIIRRIILVTIIKSVNFYKTKIFVIFLEILEKQKENSNTNNSILKKTKHSKDQSSKDTKETGLTGFSGSSESNINFNHNINQKSSLTKSHSVINQVPQDEKLPRLRSSSINEFVRDRKNTLESKDDNNVNSNFNPSSLENNSSRKIFDKNIENIRESQSLSNQAGIDLNSDSDKVKNLDNLKNEKEVESSTKDNVQSSNLNNKSIERKNSIKKNKACCIIF
jgi:hypothetical protein